MTRFQRNARIFALRQVTTIEKVILIYLCHVADKSLSCRIQQDRIADSLSVSRRSVIRSLQDLEDRGYIDRTSQKRITTGHRDADVIKLMWLKSSFKEPNLSKFIASKSKSNVTHSHVGQGDTVSQPISNTMGDGENEISRLVLIKGGRS